MNIRRFSGFTFSADSAEKKKKVDKLTKYDYVCYLSLWFCSVVNSMKMWLLNFFSVDVRLLLAPLS